MSDSCHDLARSIGSIAADYRSPEGIAPITSRVDRWISQFDPSERATILREMNCLLQRYYWSRKRVQDSIRSFLAREDPFGPDPRASLQGMNFIRIQVEGESQLALLALFTYVVYKDYGLILGLCGGSDIFVYVDDCVYTGNRLRYDVVPWIQRYAPRGSTLIIYHIAAHLEGWQYAKGYVLDAAHQKNVTVKWFHAVEIDNRAVVDGRVEFLWPRRVSGDRNVDAYEERVTRRCSENGWALKLWRDESVVQEDFFSSTEARDIVEGAFLRVGARLVMAAGTPAPSMRPLGFKKLESLSM